MTSRLRTTDSQATMEDFLSEWRPDPKLVASDLADETAGDEFRIRPPRGFTRFDVEASGLDREYAWEGTPRDDGTRPYLRVGLAAWPDASLEAGNAALLPLFAVFLRALREQRAGWVASATESGRIGGILPFVRGRWAGADSATGHRMHGFLYVGRFRDPLGALRVAVLSSQDAAPYAFDSLRITGAAALTFRPAGSSE